MFESKDILAIVLSYAIGCISTGFYLVRLWTGTDIRKFGSGATGARNVARLLGRSGFLITFFWDFAKGLIAVWTASMLTKQHWVITASLLAVVIGHIWPAQLGFRGGKGIATALGGGLFFDWHGCSVVDVAGVAIMAIVILFAHRANLTALFRRKRIEGVAIGQIATGDNKNDSNA
ncbi:MAG: glycerol-3-phosphate acyltransferase [Sedimentisphaerales bacterium]